MSETEAGFRGRVEVVLVLRCRDCEASETIGGQEFSGLSFHGAFKRRGWKRDAKQWVCNTCHSKAKGLLRYERA